MAETLGIHELWLFILSGLLLNVTPGPDTAYIVGRSIQFGWRGGVAAATGVQVIPSVPFLQAIGMEKEELIQALGVFFTVATLALGLSLTGAGLLTAATALPGAVAMAASFAGMFIGQAVRTRLQPDIFRRWFQIGMIVLGLYLATNALAKLMSV